MPAPCVFAVESFGTAWAFPLLGVSCALLGLFAGRVFYGSRRRDVAVDEQRESDADREWGEKRAHPRHRLRQIKVMISDAQAKIPPYEGWLLNRSLGGLGLSVSNPIEAGTIVSVRPSEEMGITPWVQVEVRYCRLERGRWTLGCKFVEEAPTSALVFG